MLDMELNDEPLSLDNPANPDAKYELDELGIYDSEPDIAPSKEAVDKVNKEMDELAETDPEYASKLKQLMKGE